MEINRAFGLVGLKYGHIFLPYPGNNITSGSKEGIDYRDRIIKQFKRKQKVSVLFDNGSFANNCPVSLSALRDIEYPEKFGNVGSPVVCFIDPLHKKPMVLSVFGKEDDVDFGEEGDKKLSSIFKESKAEVGVRGKKGEVYINVDSTDELGGNIYLNVSNASNKGKLNIRVLGESNIYTLGACTISSSDTIKTTVTDDENEITSEVLISKEGKINSKVTDSSGSTEINQTSNGFTIVKGDLGLKDTLSKILNELVAFKTVSPGGAGTTDPSTITNLQGYISDLDKYMEG
jgi:hypothetical protein